MSYSYETRVPVNETFPELPVVLCGDRQQDPKTFEWDFSECILYINYYFPDASISISVFDDVTRSYLYGPEYIKDAATAFAAIEAIDAEYPGKVDIAGLRDTFELFFVVGAGSTSVSTPVSDFEAHCDQCGDYNVDTLNFLYVPAVPGTSFNEGSLEVHWEYGCYGGSKVEGTFDDTCESVKTLLERAYSMASSKKYRKEIRKALVSLEA